MTNVSRLLLLLALLVPCLAAAQTEPNGQHTEYFEQFKVALSVTASGAAAPDYFISGTNVSVGVGVLPASKPPDPNPVHDAIVLSATRLKVAGTQVDATPRAGGGGGGGGGGGAGAGLRGPAPSGLDPYTPFTISIDLPGTRFASTHFSDGGSVAIVLETDWDLKKNGVKTGSRTISATLTTTTYNRVLAWKTTRTDVGDTPNPYQSTIDAVMTEGHKAFTAANYSTESLSLGPDLIDWLQIPDHSKHVTAWFLDSHGNSTGAQDSGVAPGSSGQFQVWSHWQPTVHPLGLAIAVAYACATLPSPNDVGQLPLRIAPGNWVDGAYMGFTQTIFAYIYWYDQGHTGDPAYYHEYFLNQHTKVFCEALAAGLTVSDAMDKANKDASDAQVPVQDASGQPLRPIMSIVGDRLTTIVGVYLTAAERNSLGLKVGEASGLWYYSGYKAS